MCVLVKGSTVLKSLLLVKDSKGLPNTHVPVPDQTFPDADVDIRS